MCPQCQRPNPPTANFCSHCGAKLEVLCPRCRQRNSPGSRFCNNCGEALTVATARADAVPASYIPQHLAARILSSRGALEGERKQITVLLADLKGSMELLADRDPEEARRLLDPVLERMIEAVHHYDGTVNQVMGDGIMALFGAPLAHEDHALRACYAALRMQERVGDYGDEVQRLHGVPLQIRIGINSGDVVVRSIGSDLHMDYTAVGQTTHLAARMEQMAKPGSILVAPSTLRLVEGYVRVRSLGPVPVKGLTEPIDVCELLGSGAGRTRLQVAAARGLTRFIGRDTELEQIRAALERARNGHGEIVALVGEPGVGKSRLVWELTHSHRTQGWLILQSSSVSYGQATTLLPVVYLLKVYFGIDDRDDRRRVREKLIGKLLGLDQTLGNMLPAFQALFDVSGDDPEWNSLGAEAQRERLRDAVKRLLLRETLVQPALLVFEDLHWIDSDTQAFLDSLVESLPSHRVMLLVNYRPEYRHDWGSKSYYRQVRLDPLLPQTAETLLEVLLGADPSLTSVRSLLIERAQGNPLFLEECVRSLTESGVIEGERGGYRATKSVQVFQVPATVQAILAGRIDRLAPDDKTLLQSAAVVGHHVPLALLEEIADATKDNVAGGLARLQAGEFLYEARLFPDIEYTFKHALTHEVAYGTLLHERRRALHAKVVAAIERLYPDRLPEHRDRLLHHAFRGEVWAKAFAHLKDLGEVASPEDIGEVMGGPESAGQLWWIGHHERALRAAERDLAVSASFGDFSTRIRATCRLGQAHHALGDYKKAAELFRQAIASLGPDLAHNHFGMAAFPSVWARSWLAWTLAELGEFDEGVTAGEEAIALAESGDHSHSRAQAAFGLGMLYLIQGNVDAAIAVLERGLVVARVANIPFLVPFLSGPLGAAYLLDRRVERAVTLLEQTIEQAISMRLSAHHALRLAWLGHALLLADRGEAAGNLARRALETAEEQRECGQQAYAHHLLAAVAERHASHDVAAQAYGRALALAESLSMHPLAARCRLGLARVHAEKL